MTKPLRILHLEDDPDYSEFVGLQLREAGIEHELVVVSTRAGFENALAENGFDLVLADYLLPDFDGLQALALARERCPQVPFLLVSGTIGEQAAIDSLRNGATDYVLKQCPERLTPAVRRAAREAEERARRHQAEAEVLRREAYFRKLTENCLDLLTIIDHNGILLYSSPSVARVLGYSASELRGLCVFSFVHPEDLARVTATFEQLLSNADWTLTLEFRCKHREGLWIDLEAVGRNQLGDPDICGVVITSRNVTDRRRAEDKLRQSEEQYRLIFDGNPMPMWIFDHESLRILEVNDAAVQHYGYTREEFLAMTMADVRPSSEEPAMIEYMHHLVQSDGSQPGLLGNWVHRKKDGTLMQVELRWGAITFQGRKASLAMINDISSRCRIEHRDAALSKLGQLLSTASSPVEAAEIIRSVADELFGWDAFVLNLYSDEREQVTPIYQVDTDRSGMRFLVPPESMESKPASNLARRVIAQGAELILREEPLCRSGDANPFGDLSRVSASLMVTPIRNGTRVIGLLSIQSYTLNAYDASDLATLQTLADHCGGALERIRAEEALHRSEKRFRELFEGSPDAIFVEDFEGTVLDVNPAACRLHGCSREELVGVNVMELVPEEQRELTRNSLPAMAAGTLHQVEGYSLNAEGVPVSVEVCVSRIEYSGKPALLLHVRDITERRRTEAALSSSESLFHSVWVNSVDGMRLTDENGRIIAVNEAYCRLVSKAREELEGELYTVAYAESEHHEESLQRYRQRFADRVIDKQVEVTLRLHNGEEVTLEDTNSFVEQRHGPPLLLSLFRDVTEQRRLQEQLRQAQKMEAIGQLAGGVAHDFNNILTVIHGHASLLMAMGALPPVPTRSAEQIIQAAERAAGLTRQLLAFGRRQIMQPRLIDMNEVVCNMTKMLGRLLGEDVALQLNYSPQPALVHADGSMVEQVLLNFAVNSRDAMPQGGVLSLRVSVVEIGESYVVQHPEAHTGRYICLTAGDTGCGISPEHMERIFEPFFTTKQVGKGTGLGLATVYGIVKQHQGWVEVESQVGRGTLFRAYFPAAGAADGGTERPEPTARASRGGTETILVVEDEAPVRELVCQLLASQGYHILQAESGVKALELWRECKDQVDLVLTDMVMPDRINGRELAEKLWAERPTLKVIFTSGYSADVVGKDFVLRTGLNYLQKPYHPDRLAGVVRDCLDAVN